MIYNLFADMDKSEWMNHQTYLFVSPTLTSPNLHHPLSHAPFILFIICSKISF
jgi:hypothetical protein